MANHSIEIDVTLNMDTVGRDFDRLEQSARSGVRSVVRAADQMTIAIAEIGTEARGTAQDYGRAADQMADSSVDAADSTSDLGEAVEETADSTEDLGDHLQNMEDAQEDLRRATEETTESQEEFQQSTEESTESQEEFQQTTEDTTQSVEKSRESFLHWGNIAKTAITGVTVVAGALFAAMGAGAGAAVKFGTEYKQASNSIQASTGATKEEMQELSEVMKNVYANNFGEDMNDVADAVANVKKNIGGTDEEIQKATENAFAFRDTFGYEIPESTRAAKAMMDNFGISVETAYDLMAKGAQNGLDYSGELIDNINEYSVQFGKAGLSAADMFNIMQSGADSGAWNLDKIGDAVKELNVRLVDGSDTTAEGLKAIGMNADEVAKKMSQGGDVARETYQKVVKGLAEMDDKQAQNIAGVNLFGTMWEDLGPGVVAQLGTLEGAYNDVSGTMNQINEVKYDDAGSALEALKRKAQTSLLLPISEDILPAISGATEAAAGYIDQLASAYESEGINGLIEEAGNIFSDIATKAAEEAPHMVEIAASFIEQMVEGFKSNSGRLAEAGENLVRSMCSAAVQLLPSELQKPVEEAVDDVISSVTGGGIKNALKTFKTMFENGFKAVTKVTKTVLPPFVKIVDKTADNMDVLIPLVAGAAAAFKGYAIVQTVTKNIKAMSAVTATLTAMERANALQVAAATGALTLKQMAVGVLTGKITLATAAQAAWNAVLSAFGGPVGLVLTGVAAVTGALAAYNLITDNSSESQENLNESLEKVNDQFDTVGDSVRTFSDGMKNAGSIFDDFNDSIIVSNEVQQEVAERMDSVQSEITQIAKTATEERRELTQSEIDRLGELFTQMKEITEQELAIQNSYAAAVKDSAESLASTYEGNAEGYQQASLKIINSAYETKDAVVDKAYEQMLETNAVNKQLADNVEGYSQEWYEEQTRASQERYQQAVDAANKECGDTLAIVQQGYMDRADAGIEYLTKVIEANAQVEEEKERHNSALEDLDEAYKEDWINNEYNIQTAQKEYNQKTRSENEAHTQKMADIWGQLTDSMSREQLEQAGVLLAMVAQTATCGENMDDETKTLVTNFIDSLSGMPDETREKFENTVKGAMEGLEGFDEIEKIAEDQGISFLEALAEVLDVHSPSKAVKEIFSYVAPGAIAGLEEGKSGLMEKGKELVSSFLGTLESADLKGAGKQVTEQVVNGFNTVNATGSGILLGMQYATGVSETKKKNSIVGKGIATTTRAAIAAISALMTGRTFGEQYATGVSETKKKNSIIGNAVAASARAAMAAVDATLTGTTLGSQFASGVGSKNSAAKSAGTGLSVAAASGLTVGDFYGKGADAGQGYVNGMLSKLRAAADAGAQVALAAMNAVKQTQASNSPSKKTLKLGKDFDQGYINGIVALAGEAIISAGEMGRKSVQALKENLCPVSLDFDVETAMQRTDAVVASRVSSYAAPQTEVQKQYSGTDEWKKKADYFLSNLREMLDGQETVCEWKDREIMRMFRELRV